MGTKGKKQNAFSESLIDPSDGMDRDNQHWNHLSLGAKGRGSKVQLLLGMGDFEIDPQFS